MACEWGVYPCVVIGVCVCSRGARRGGRPEVQIGCAKLEKGLREEELERRA
jgi:hypothetical protein